MKKSGLIFTVIVLMFSVFVSCENEDDENGENKDMSSSFNENESHNAGQNCMACHKSGGQGEGWFTVAGTVYNASKTAVPKCYSKTLHRTQWNRHVGENHRS